MSENLTLGEKQKIFFTIMMLEHHLSKVLYDDFIFESAFDTLKINSEKGLETYPFETSFDEILYSLSQVKEAIMDPSENCASLSLGGDEIPHQGDIKIVERRFKQNINLVVANINNLLEMTNNSMFEGKRSWVGFKVDNKIPSDYSFHEFWNQAKRWMEKLKEA